MRLIRSKKRNLFKRRQANEKRTIIYNEGKKKEFDDEKYTYKETKWSPKERNYELLKLNPTGRLLRKSGEKKI